MPSFGPTLARDEPVGVLCMGWFLARILIPANGSDHADVFRRPILAATLESGFVRVAHRLFECLASSSSFPAVVGSGLGSWRIFREVSRSIVRVGAAMGVHLVQFVVLH